MMCRMLLAVLLSLPQAVIAARPEQAIKSPAADELALGRVFMTPAERETLDRLRKQAPVDTTVTASDTAIAETPVKRRLLGAGYIMSSGGVAYEWRGGDFRQTKRDDIDSSRFPGNIVIERHPEGARGRKAVAEKRPAETATKESTDDVGQ